MFDPSRKIAVTPPAGLWTTLGVAALVSALATALSYLLPDSWAATGVGFTFLFATYRLVIRDDDVATIRDYGLSLGGLLADAPGQLLVIALPEEAFYRGYLQTALARALNEDEQGALTLFGARIGWSIVITSAIFALGHLLTELNPARLAVFFPSLVFGLLRSRTRGIGSGVLFHALCNLYSAYLMRSYFGG